MSSRSLDAGIARIASKRYGVFSRVEAVREGATQRMIHTRIASGRWKRLHPGVYRLEGAPGSWRQALAAVCLAAGPIAVGSHHAAARLWQLAGVAWHRIEISVPLGRRHRCSDVVVHEVAQLSRVDVTMVEAIPVTTPTRTLIDLAAVISEDQLAEAVDDALRRGLTTISRLRRGMERLGSRRGSAGLSRVLNARAPVEPIPQSVLETRFLRLVERANLPGVERQYRVRDRGRSIGVVDFAYPELRIAIEIDGYRWHSGRAPWERDLARRNLLTALGWSVIHITSTDLEQRPNHVIELISAARRRLTVPGSRGNG